MSLLPVISNSSPLIALEQIGQLNLLENLFGAVIVPPAVAQEVVNSVILPNWITLHALTQPVAARILTTSLGPGESEVISVALELGSHQVILDDRAARRLAQALSIPVIGTIGILLAAKRNGLLSVIRPQLDALLSFNFHLAPTVYDLALKEAGE